MFTLTTVAWLVALGAGFGLTLTWLARGIASRVGMLDAPDGHRKLQEKPIPVAGGVAVLLAAGLTLLIMSLVVPSIGQLLIDEAPHAVPLLAASVLIVLVGLADDRFNLRARYKLLGQVLAILVLVIPGGFVIHQISVFGLTLQLGVFAIPFTVLWLLACVNALNLIDGMDGLLGTVGGIALVSLAVLAIMMAKPFAAIVALALAGAVFGFLWWNLPPATIYMGDAGSMLIGLVIGALAIPASLKGPATVALGAPLAILVLPMFDTTAAVIRRKLTGRGLATSDRGHLHHVLQRNGLTTWRVLMVVAVLGLVAATGALASIALQNDVFALVAAGGVVVSLVVGKLFGHTELRLLHKRALATARNWWPLGRTNQPWQLEVRLQGTAKWEHVWEDLTGCAPALNVQTLCLDVNAPAMYESYHARWDRAEAIPEGYLCRLEIPLFGHGLPIGRLTVTLGRLDDQPLTDTLQLLAKIIETAEVRTATVTAPLSSARPVAPPLPPQVTAPVRV